MDKKKTMKFSFEVLADEELVVLAQNGDADAEEQLYIRYKSMIKMETRKLAINYTE